MVSQIEWAWESFLWRIAVDTDDLLQRAERLRKEGSMENPYPETVKCEEAGTRIPNERHRIWDEAFEAGTHSIIVRVGKKAIEKLHPNFFRG